MEKFFLDGVLHAFKVSIGSEKSSEFFSETADLLQVGTVRVTSTRPIARHIHTKQERVTYGTSEVLFVLQGTLEVKIFGNNPDQYVSFTAKAGDVFALLEGGHSMTSQTDCLLLEVKNGPYNIEQDKVYY